MQTRTLRPLCASLLLLSLTPGCKSALSLERAELDAEDDKVMSASNELVAECSTVDTQCACRSKCDGQRAACLGDSGCRKALYLYSLCLGEDCSDDRPEQNCEELFETADEGSLPILTLSTCLDKCDQASCESAIVSRCERYCACMHDHCEAHLDATWGTTHCMERCSQVDPSVLNCQVTHCEMARKDAIHCSHALPDGDEHLDQCGFLSEQSAFVCLDGIELGGACDEETPCCEGLTCHNHTCE